MALTKIRDKLIGSLRSQCSVSKREVLENGDNIKKNVYLNDIFGT